MLRPLSDLNPHCAWLIRLALFSIVVAALHTIRLPTLEPNRYDAWDYAQIARNTASGEILATRAVVPLQLRFTPRLPAPDLKAVMDVVDVRAIYISGQGDLDHIEFDAALLSRPPFEGLFIPADTLTNGGLVWRRF